MAGLPRPVTLDTLVAGFAAADPHARWWSAYPHVPDLWDESRPDCAPMSRAFAAYCAEQGVTAWVVVGADPDYADDPMLDWHAWTVVLLGGQARAVDWTARQFWNVTGPAAAQALAAPVPLVWPAERPHPLLAHRTVTAA